MNKKVRSFLMTFFAVIGFWAQGEVVTLAPGDIGTVEGERTRVAGGLTFAGNWGYYTNGVEQGWFVSAGSSVAAPAGKRISQIVMTMEDANAHAHVYGLAAGWTFAEGRATWSGTAARNVAFFAELKDPAETVEIFGYSQIAVTLETSNVTVSFNPSSVPTLDPIPSQSLAVGSKVARPTDPVDADGQRDFAAWYRESECQNIWDFETDTVSDDTELFAYWMEKATPVFSGSGTQGDPWVLNDFTPVATNLLLRKGAVVRVGNAWYADLQHAFDACAVAQTAPVITLVTNVTRAGGAFVAKGQSVLDLAGFDVSCASFTVGGGTDEVLFQLRDSGVDVVGVLSATNVLRVSDAATFDMRGGALAQEPTVSESGIWRVARGFFDFAVAEARLAPGSTLQDGAGSGYAYAVAPAVSGATIVWQVTPGPDFNGATVSGVLSGLSYGGRDKSGTLTVRVRRDGAVVATEEVSVSGFVSQGFSLACEEIAAQGVYDYAISFTASGESEPCASDELGGVVAAKAFTDWMAEDAATFQAGGTTGVWSGFGARVEEGRISFDSESGVRFDGSEVPGCRYRVVSKMTFGSAGADDPIAADAQAGVKLASDGETFRFCCLVDGGWVTNTAVTADVDTEYAIGITFDYGNRLVSYDVEGVALASGAITGRRSGVTGLTFVGTGLVDAIDGDYWDANVVEAGGEEYASVEAAVAAGHGALAADALALLWDATWRPAADIAAGTYHFAPGGYALMVDDTDLVGAGRALTDNGDGSYTVSGVTAEMIADAIAQTASTPEAAEAARAKVLSVSGGNAAEAQALAEWMTDKSVSADAIAAGEYVEASFNLGTELLDEGDTVVVTALSQPADDGTVGVSFQIRDGDEVRAVAETARATDYARNLLKVGTDPNFAVTVACTCASVIDGATKTVTVTATPDEVRAEAFYKVEIPADANID